MKIRCSGRSYRGNEERGKTEDGTILIEKETAKEGQSEYFEGLLYVEEDKETEIVAIGKINGVKVFGGLNNAQILKDEV